jgi:hypothetical protein
MALAAGLPAVYHSTMVDMVSGRERRDDDAETRRKTGLLQARPDAYGAPFPPQLPVGLPQPDLCHLLDALRMINHEIEL